MAKPIDCGSNCGWKWGRVKKCKEIRDCACRCAPLQAINPNLYEGCKNQCNSSNSDDRPKDEQDYMCNYVGGEAIFTNYGILECGFQVEDSAQHLTWSLQKQQEEIETAESKKMTKGIIIAMVGLVIFGFVSIIRARTS